jgi:hypothetical protein
LFSPLSLQVRVSQLREEMAEGRLRAVSCLKGSLMEELEDQNSLIIDRGGEVAGLRIELEELKVRADHMAGENRSGGGFVLLK